MQVVNQRAQKSVFFINVISFADLLPQRAGTWERRGRAGERELCWGYASTQSLG